MRYCQLDNRYCLVAQGFWLEIALYIDLFAFCSFINWQQLSLKAINDVLVELAMILPEIQLMLSEKVFFHYCKLKKKKTVPSRDVINIWSNIHTLIFSFNFSKNYWYVAKANCHKSWHFLIIYNSLLCLDINFIKTWLFTVLNYIINANSIAY